MTNLYFVRHGESTMNLRPDIVGGRSNHAELTNLGETQAKAFGTWLRQARQESIVIDGVQASPAVRTQATARHILDTAGLRLRIMIDDRIQELGQGIKEGADREATYSPEILEQIAKEQFDFKFEDSDTSPAESIREVMDRKEEFASDMYNRFPNRSLLVVGHGFAIRSLAGRINDASHKTIVSKYKTPNVSLTHISVSSDGMRVVGEIGQDVAHIKSLVVDESV